MPPNLEETSPMWFTTSRTHEAHRFDTIHDELVAAFDAIDRMVATLASMPAPAAGGPTYLRADDRKVGRRVTALLRVMASPVWRRPRPLPPARPARSATERLGIHAARRRSPILTLEDFELALGSMTRVVTREDGPHPAITRHEVVSLGANLEGLRPFVEDRMLPPGPDLVVLRAYDGARRVELVCNPGHWGIRADHEDADVLPLGLGFELLWHLGDSLGLAPELVAKLGSRGASSKPEPDVRTLFFGFRSRLDALPMPSEATATLLAVADTVLLGGDPTEVMLTYQDDVLSIDTCLRDGAWWFRRRLHEARPSSSRSLWQRDLGALLLPDRVPSYLHPAILPALRRVLAEADLDGRIPAAAAARLRPLLERATRGREVTHEPTDSPERPDAPNT